MPRFIVTGCYTQSALQGMMASPSDRGAAANEIVTTAGGTLEAYYLTTGPTDFLMVISIDDVTHLGAGLIVAGAAGAICNVQTQRAFDSATFTAMQQKAADIAASYAAPG